MIHEFDTEVEIINQMASIDVSYHAEECEDNYGREYTAIEIASVVWKVKHTDKNGRTPCGTDMHASEKWFYLDITEMLSKESLALILKEAEEHYEEFCAPDYSEHSPSRNRFFYEPTNYPGSPIQVAP
jgi:hypothetical protein